MFFFQPVLLPHRPSLLSHPDPDRAFGSRAGPRHQLMRSRVVSQNKYPGKRPESCCKSVPQKYDSLSNFMRIHWNLKWTNGKFVFFVTQLEEQLHALKICFCCCWTKSSETILNACHQLSSEIKWHQFLMLVFNFLLKNIQDYPLIYSSSAMYKTRVEKC